MVNLGNGQFAEAAAALGADSLGDGRGIAASDFDADGDLDLIVSNYNKPANYFVNNHASGNWLQIRLHGQQSNRDGIGAIVRARTGETSQMRVITAGDGFGSQYSRVAHFGLSEAQRVDELSIEWPSGKRQRFHDVPANQRIDIREDEEHIYPAGTSVHR